MLCDTGRAVFLSRIEKLGGPFEDEMFENWKEVSRDVILDDGMTKIYHQAEMASEKRPVWPDCMASGRRVRCYVVECLDFETLQSTR
jgi:hypothetical protein